MYWKIIYLFWQLLTLVQTFFFHGPFFLTCQIWSVLHPQSQIDITAENSIPVVSVFTLFSTWGGWPEKFIGKETSLKILVLCFPEEQKGKNPKNSRLKMNWVYGLYFCFNIIFWLHKCRIYRNEEFQFDSDLQWLMHFPGNPCASSLQLMCFGSFPMCRHFCKRVGTSL